MIINSVWIILLLTLYWGSHRERTEFGPTDCKFCGNSSSKISGSSYQYNLHKRILVIIGSLYMRDSSWRAGDERCNQTLKAGFILPRKTAHASHICCIVGIEWSSGGTGSTGGESTSFSARANQPHLRPQRRATRLSRAALCTPSRRP